MQKRTEFPLDPMSILLFVMLGVFIFMMFRRNKKTQQQQAELQSKFGPGVDVMTSFGLFGRIVDIDDEENKVTLELSPGNLATVHRQAVTKIVEPAAVPAADAIGFVAGIVHPAGKRRRLGWSPCL